MSPRYLIIIPTYNEKENIESILNAIITKTEGIDVHILVVDDNSPDGTAGIVKNKMHGEYGDAISLLQGEKKLGIAKAYVKGFQWGIKREYDVLIEMDADLSHDPGYLSGMLASLDGYDCIIGSRYVRGGGVIDRSVLRNAISRCGTLFSRILLKTPMRDLTGGFNVWKRHALERVQFDTCISKGYSFQIELKYRAYRQGARFLEYPIVFKDRIHGKSKMSFAIFLEAIFAVVKLKLLAMHAGMGHRRRRKTVPRDIVDARTTMIQ